MSDKELDIDGNGLVTSDDLAISKARAQHEKSDAQRRMAWASMICPCQDIVVLASEAFGLGRSIVIVFTFVASLPEVRVPLRAISLAK